MNATGPEADEYFLASASDVELSARILAFWADFATTGAPEGWPSVGKPEHAAMLFPDADEVPSTIPNYKAAACAVWDAVQDV